MRATNHPAICFSGKTQSMRVADALDIKELFARYRAEHHTFLKPEGVKNDALVYVKQHIKGHTMGSRKWAKKAQKLTYFHHYPEQQSYVLGRFIPGKKHFDFWFSICHYVRTRRGIVYTLEGFGQERLFFFSAHFFDRLAQRHSGMMFTESQRDQAIRHGIDFFSRGYNDNDRDPLLLDLDGEAFSVMNGGYAVGQYLNLPVARPEFPQNQFGEITVCFFKTFLSDVEISTKRMDRMLQLYRINGIVDLAMSRCK